MTESSGGVFISYRRQETAYPAAWLYEQLKERLGSSQIFKDVDSLTPGDDFAEKIRTAVEACDVLLALIGEDWTTLTDESGARRLDDPEDFVRLEIEAALSRNVRVVPLLVAGAHMPHPDQLPAGLRGLARRQALELSSTRFGADTQRLIGVVEATLQEAHEARTASLTPSGAPPEADTKDRPAGVAAPIHAPPDVEPAGAVAGVSGFRLRTASRRRVVLAVTLAVLLVAGGITVALNRRSGSAGSPWRMVIAGNAGPGGCGVRLTNMRTGEVRIFEGIYSQESRQLLDEGNWRWTTSDPRCVVTTRSGGGTAELPFVLRVGSGDSDGFRADGPVTVTILEVEAQASSCDLELRSLSTGGILAFATATVGGPPATLDPDSPTTVYIADSYCGFRVSAG